MKISSPRFAGADPSKGSQMRLPTHSKPPELETTEWGGRFPGQRYFPMYLGNGTDAILINISGSGDGHWERAPYSADILGKTHSLGWFKADRRMSGDKACVYGSLIPLGEVSGAPHLHHDALVPRDVEQYFDPKSATLTTFFRQSDNRSNEEVALRIRTFLTSGSLLIQEVTVLECPACGVGYSFTLGTASPSYQNQFLPTVRPERYSCSTDRDIAFLRSEWPGLTGVGFSLVLGAEVSSRKARELPEFDFLELEQEVAPLAQGSSFVRVVSFQDEREEPGAEARCSQWIDRLRREGIDGVRAEHQREWESYFGSSSVVLPDPSAQFAYEVSRYVIKANNHPKGYQPVGLLPYQWQGAMFWDASVAHEAFLTCNNTGEARKILGHVTSLVPLGRELARSLGKTGSRLEWTINLDSFTQYEPPCRQFHNNAVWALLICVGAFYEARPSDFAKHHEAIEELLAFLLDTLGTDPANPPTIIGIDESESDPKPHDTWTSSVLLKAMEAYLELSREFGQPVRLQGVEQWIERLRTLRDDNVDARGVLQSFDGGTIPHWGSIIFDMFPDHPAALATLSAMAENSKCGRYFNFHGLNRYAERSFPWTGYKVSRCLAKLGRPEALLFFLNTLDATNYFGGVPERVFYHGENYIDWFSTGHAAQILALNSMLANCTENSLSLLAGIDLQLWPSLSFESIMAGGGLKVSLEIKDRKIHGCEIENLGSTKKRIQVRVPPMGMEMEADLAPGWNTLDLSSG